MFVRCRSLATMRTVMSPYNAGKAMELLQLEPPNYGVHSSGIYIIDDDGATVLAGPFKSEHAAVEWINQRQETVKQHRLAAE